MDCGQTEWLSNKEYLEQFSKRVAQERVPLSGSIGLTRRCNLKCVHCYVGDKEDIAKNDRREFSAAQWISTIDEITEAGCLYLLITGGDPLFKKDFGKIYSHAKKKGLLVTVFTNGTLIKDHILELFDDLPPHCVEISLYGATADTYEKITRINGSYEKCLRGIERLLDHQINVKLKTILMTLNRQEFYEMEKMAKDYGVSFRFDPAIFPRFDGDKSPLDLRVSAREAIEKEFSNEERSRQWKDFYERMREISISNALYNCGAGLAYFHIDAFGNLQPCLMVKDLHYDLAYGSFSEGWRNDVVRIREKNAGAAYSCNKCEKMALCGFCPAFFKLENGAEDIFSEYLCALGQHRFQAIEHTRF